MKQNVNVKQTNNQTDKQILELYNFTTLNFITLVKTLVKIFIYYPFVLNQLRIQFFTFEMKPLFFLRFIFVQIFTYKIFIVFSFVTFFTLIPFSHICFKQNFIRIQYSRSPINMIIHQSYYRGKYIQKSIVFNVKNIVIPKLKNQLEFELSQIQIRKFLAIYLPNDEKFGTFFLQKINTKISGKLLVKIFCQVMVQSKNLYQIVNSDNYHQAFCGEFGGFLLQNDQEALYLLEKLDQIYGKLIQQIFINFSQHWKIYLTYIQIYKSRHHTLYPPLKKLYEKANQKKEQYEQQKKFVICMLAHIQGIKIGVVADPKQFSSNCDRFSKSKYQQLFSQKFKNIFLLYLIPLQESLHEQLIQLKDRQQPYESSERVKLNIHQISQYIKRVDQSLTYPISLIDQVQDHEIKEYFQHFYYKIYENQQVESQH